MEKKVREDEDFIHAPKFNNSLNKFLAKNDSPLENSAISRVLLIPPEEVERVYEESVEALKREMNPDEDRDL